MLIRPLLLTLLSAPALAQPAHPTLLPNVTHLRYDNGSIPLCRLQLSGDLAHEDAAAVQQLRTLLHDHCPTRLFTPAPVVGSPTITLHHDEDSGPLPGPDDHVTTRESYTISITAKGVRLNGHTPTGLFYAVQTFRQLIEDTSVPYVDIEDTPSLPYRGFMMDMSHGAVLTVDEVKHQLDLLARFKANQYFFYVETNLTLGGFPLLEQPSNWSKEDIRTIVTYARDRHIDVVPCVELYGHLHDLFRLERYSPLAALPHGGEANPASPEAQHLLEDWLRQFAALFPSPWLHLGFDEPFELERAGSKAAGGTAPDVLWLQHLQRMANLAASLGKRPLFWADIDEGAYIFNKYPGLAAGLPKGAIAAPWFYDARPDYSNLLDLFAEHHVPILVATGISDWDNIAPDFDSTFINIDGFLAAGRKANTIGLLNTEWSDSALALHREAEPALIYGAAAAWQSSPVDRATFFTSYANLTYPTNIAPKVSAALTHITRAQTLLREALGSETVFRLFDDPFHPTTLARITKNAEALHKARLEAEDAQQAIVEAQHLDPHSSELESLSLAAAMLDYTGMKFQYATEIAANFDALPAHPTQADIGYLLKRETSARNHSRVGDLIDLSGELAQRYREEWLKQYKPNRLPTALARWQNEQTFWLNFQQKVWTLTRDFKEGDPRPTLETTLSSH